jgi:hypothetical protein
MGRGEGESGRGDVDMGAAPDVFLGREDMLGGCCAVEDEGD